MFTVYLLLNFTYHFFHLKLKSMAQKEDLVWYWLWVLWYGFRGYPDLESLYLVWHHVRYWVAYILSNYTGRTWVLIFCMILCHYSNLQKDQLCFWKMCLQMKKMSKLYLTCWFYSLDYPKWTEEVVNMNFFIFLS